MKINNLKYDLFSKKPYMFEMPSGTLSYNILRLTVKCMFFLSFLFNNASSQNKGKENSKSGKRSRQEQPHSSQFVSKYIGGCYDAKV